MLHGRNGSGAGYSLLGRIKYGFLFWIQEQVQSAAVPTNIKIGNIAFTF